MTAQQPLVIALVPELMTQVRLAEGAERAGLELRPVSPDAWSEALDGAPAAALIDLTAGEDLLAAIEVAAASGVPVLAFGPHVDEQALAAAKVAGAQTVLTRGQLLADPSTHLSALIRT